MCILFIDSYYICLGGASTSATMCTCQHRQQQQQQRVKDIVGYLCLSQHKHSMHACRSIRSSAVVTCTVAKVFNISTLLIKSIVFSCYVYVSFRDMVKRVWAAERHHPHDCAFAARRRRHVAAARDTYHHTAASINRHHAMVPPTAYVKRVKIKRRIRKKHTATAVCDIFNETTLPTYESDTTVDGFLNANLEQIRETVKHARSPYRSVRVQFRIDILFRRHTDKYTGRATSAPYLK